MQIEVANHSHIGHREENQDRAEVLIGDHAVLAMVIDGMGGHTAGAEAAATTIATIDHRFRHSKQPLPFPERFLARVMSEAHDAVVRLGQPAPVDDRPRATCALCLVQQDTAYWAHVGDSRVYHLRDGEMLVRTRDHTHVELLLQEGLLEESEIRTHPMRSYVEHCLGGEQQRPPATVAGPHLLQSGDLLLVCSDGVWGGTTDRELAVALSGADGISDLQQALECFVDATVASNAPNSDNATAAAIRWVDNDPR